MILDFSFDNYKSFRDETTLDFKANIIAEHRERLTSLPDLDLLPAAVIFGANASGKSNLIDALHFMIHYIKESIQYSYSRPDIHDRFRSSDSDKRLPRPFLLDRESRKNPSTFSVTFTLGKDPYDRFLEDRIYQYGFSLGPGNLPGEGMVTEEWLIYSDPPDQESLTQTASDTKNETSDNGLLIFERKGQKVTFGEIDSKFKKQIKGKFKPEQLILSLGELMDEPLLREIYWWFMKIRLCDLTGAYGSVWNEDELPDGLSQIRLLQLDVVTYLKAIDPSITDLRVDKIYTGYPDVDDRYRIRVLHEPLDGGPNPIEIPLGEEGSGIQKMFGFFKDFSEVIREGGLLVVDDLDAGLHPLLVRDILISFLNPKINRRHAQILMTTQDTSLLDCNLLSPDEIWFIEKSNQVSSLYSLSSFRNLDGQILQDERLQKNYLKGRYGAIPFLENFFRHEQ